MGMKEKSGQIFIAYKGTELSADRIRNKLSRVCPCNYTVIEKSDYGFIFAKVVYDQYIEDRDPFFDNNRRILTVNGYNQNEIEIAAREYNYSINDEDRLHRLINYVYQDYATNMFKELSPYLHFCSVIYEEDSKNIIAGVTVPNSEYTHLYYGYTPRNKEMMFSNNEDVLKEFVEQVYEMDNNTYSYNGEFYSLDGIKKENNQQPELIKKIEDYLVKELDLETQKMILTIVKKAIEDCNA